MYLPHHLAAFRDFLARYDGRQQVVVVAFWLGVLAVGTYVIGVELLVALGALLLLDLATDPIHWLLD